MSTARRYVAGCLTVEQGSYSPVAHLPLLGSGWPFLAMPAATWCSLDPIPPILAATEPANHA